MSDDVIWIANAIYLAVGLVFGFFAGRLWQQICELRARLERIRAEREAAR
jgi:uncharacterized membrane-anchored protein YhcB (DUF1043 family)